MSPESRFSPHLQVVPVVGFVFALSPAELPSFAPIKSHPFPSHGSATSLSPVNWILYFNARLALSDCKQGALHKTETTNITFYGLILAIREWTGIFWSIFCSLLTLPPLHHHIPSWFTPQASSLEGEMCRKKGWEPYSDWFPPAPEKLGPAGCTAAFWGDAKWLGGFGAEHPNLIVPRGGYRSQSHCLLP